MSPIRLSSHLPLILALAAAAPGCSGSGADKIVMATACEQLLKCYSAAQPTTFPTIRREYGPDSECWKTAAAAQLCTTACLKSLELMRKQFPKEDSCRKPPDAGVPGQDQGPGGDGGASKPPPCKTVAADKDRDVDILFVIDNSGSMKAEQGNLANNFPAFMNQLMTPGGGNKQPNVRFGVVSSDLGAGNLYTDNTCYTDGDKGALHNKAQVLGCTPPRDKWIEYKEVNGVPSSNVPGGGDPITQVKDAFSCIAKLGTDGCGFEHTLLSSMKALDSKANINPGFLRNGDPCKAGRDDAILGVLFITDEDDCSAANQQVFDPSQQGLNDPLGPLTSFRCFEFGVQCTCPGKPKCDRFTQGPRTNCKPGGQYLHKVDNFISFFKNLKKYPVKDGSGKCVAKANPHRVVMAAIAGPTGIRPYIERNGKVTTNAQKKGHVTVGVTGTYPTLKPSCSINMGGKDNQAVPAVRVQALVHAFAHKLTAKEIADNKAVHADPSGSTAHYTPYWTDGTGSWREQNFATICSTSYAEVLKSFARRINQLRGTKCADL